MIDRLRLTAAAKTQLVTLKKRTGIEHYNGLCRHALCLSLANPSKIPEEIYNFNGGIDIDWKTFTGNNETLYFNLLLLRLSIDGTVLKPESVRHLLIQHVHRGLSYLVSKNANDLLIDLAKSISTMPQNNS
jgi:DNA sulfur modification protein DndE